ncbi:MAG: LptF/LptG family permease [Phycisphaerales bacterium]|nr:MAG: LptF/LptG family permease [Phycisphaerales bacterium]
MHRYIFRELFKVFVPTAIALTLILSLGIVLRPMQEYGVGPRQVVSLMGYFLPVTLTFVLPIAALFAGALAYGRLANDNEIDACKASGISLATLIYPGLALAIAIAIANLLLSFHVTPAFVHRAEESFKADARQILFRNVQRRGYYKPPGSKTLIYADHADMHNNLLAGVVAIETRDGTIGRINTAETAKVLFDLSEERNEVQITAYNTYQMVSDDDLWFHIPFISLRPEFGPLMRDDIRFKRINDMKEIQADLMRFGPVATLARQLYAQFTAELVAQDIAAGIAHDANESYELLGEPNSVRFTARRSYMQEDGSVELTGGVVLAEYDTKSKRHLRTLRGAEATLYIEGNEFPPVMTIDIYNAQDRDTGDLVMRHIVHGLIPPKKIADKPRTGSILEDIRPQAISSALASGPGSKLSSLQNALQRAIHLTLVQIKAEIHSRLVFGVGCVPMILIGIGLGVIKRGGHLLSAFAASCVPAAVLIVCLMSGYEMTRNVSAKAVSGVAVMWAGFALLSVLVVVIYHRLLRR